jgi:hypothetical protein
MVQQACVDTCNNQGWVIPFTQVTVHSADNGVLPEQATATTSPD